MEQTISRNILKKQARTQKVKRALIYHAFLIPGVILLILFKYIPLVGGITMAFQDFKSAAGFFGYQEWVGFENFEYIFSLPDIWRIVGNTVYIALWKMVLLIVVPVIVALLLNEVKNVKYRNFLQTLMILPHFISWVLLAGVYQNVLSSDSIFYQLTGQLVLTDSDQYVSFTIISEVLKEYGFSSIIYMAAIAGIDQSQYEAARLDGCGRFRAMFKITLPNIKHVILLMSLLSLGNIFSAGFDQIYNTYNSAVVSRGEILDTLIYTMGMNAKEYSLSAALGLMKSCFSTVLMAIAYFFAWKKEGYHVF